MECELTEAKKQQSSVYVRENQITLLEDDNVSCGDKMSYLICKVYINDEYSWYSLGSCKNLFKKVLGEK